MVSFSFSEGRLEIFVPESPSFALGMLSAKHSTDQATMALEVSTLSSEGVTWWIPLSVFQSTGVYSFHYRSDPTSESRALGREIGRALKHDHQRSLSRVFFQKDGKLYEASLYVPYTKQSVRLKIRSAFQAPSQKKIDHLTIKRAKRVQGAFVLEGSAFVPGIPSKELTPSLILRNSEGTVVWEIAADRRRSMRNQKKYGFADCDYTESGYWVKIPCNSALSKPFLGLNARLQMSIRLRGKNGEVFERELVENPKALGARGRTLASKKPFSSNKILALISAKDNDQLHLVVKPAESVNSVANTIKRRIAWYSFKKLGRPQSEVWLLYEFESSAAQDNAIALFEFLQKHRRDIRSRFVIDKNSPSARHLRNEYGWRSILYKYSLRHFWALLTAKILVSSQSRFHGYRLAPPMHDPIGREMSAKPFVFLQHGVIALKKIAFHRRNPRVRADIFTASTEFEQSIICREYGYRKEEVPLIGMPRLDRLVDRSDDFNEIMISPTWRQWLRKVTDDEFSRSDFVKAYRLLIGDHALEETCRTNGTRIKFVLHPMIAAQAHCFGSLPAHVDLIVSGGEPVNEMMMKAKILVTDYSSIAWDFIYMKKPVAFFQFDRRKFEAVHGSYIDAPTVLKENFSEKAQDIAKLIVGWLNGESITFPEFNRFEYCDRDNSARSVNRIEAFLESQTEKRKRFSAISAMQEVGQGEIAGHKQNGQR